MASEIQDCDCCGEELAVFYRRGGPSVYGDDYEPGAGPALGGKLSLDDGAAGAPGALCRSCYQQMARPQDAHKWEFIWPPGSPRGAIERCRRSGPPFPLDADDIANVGRAEENPWS